MMNERSRKLYIALGIILGIAFFLLLRSCSSNDTEDMLYTIGRDTRWKELLLPGKEAQLVAFNSELLTKIAQEGNFRLRLTTNLEPIQELRSGKLEGILSTISPEKATDNYLFSDPYFLIGPVLIVSAAPETEVEKERKVKIIGIPQNSPLLSSLENDPTSQIKIYDDILSALSDVRSKKIDGAIFPVLPANFYVKNYFNNELKIATPPLTDEGIRVVTLNTDEGRILIEKFNKGLKTLKENGSYEQLLESWGLINTELLR